MEAPVQQHGLNTTPKCLRCGTVTPWKVEAILLPRHFVISFLLLFLFGGGIVYFIVVLLVRSNPNSRAKICPRCGARNMWTFI